MTRHLLFLSLSTVAAAGCRRGAAPSADAPPAAVGTQEVAELSKFAGTWVVTAAKLEADDLSNQVGLEWTFAAGMLTIRNAEGVLDTSKVVPNPAASPKAVDITSDHLREGESSALFIYEFVGDELRLCRGDKARPTAFGGEGNVVFTLKRKKG